MRVKFMLLFVAAVFLSGCSLFDKQKFSGIQVLTNDMPSSVFIDGQYLDKTPLIKKNIKPGSYTIRIEPDDTNFVPYETTVSLSKGLLTVITWKPGERPELSGGVVYEMEPISDSKSEISFISIPDGAIVSLDGSDKEFAPTSFKDIEPGHHEFEVTLPSYETQKHTINAIAGHRMIVNIKLAKINPVNSVEDITLNQDQETVPADETSTASPSATPEEPAPTTAVVSPSPSPSTAPTSSSSRLNTLLSGTPSSPSASTQNVIIQPTNFFQQGQEVLRVRSTPGSSGTEIGFAVVGNKYPYIETLGGWNKIDFEGQEGWVSATYSVIE